MALDLRQLRAFLAVVSTGSQGRAAEMLHVTQPALSRTIGRLEGEIGEAIFERHSKGMQLTPFGAVLLPHATLLLHESDQALEEINAMRGLARGSIRVGAVASTASMVLPRALSAVHAKWPNLNVFVLEGVWDLLADGLVKREIDLALAPIGFESSEIEAISSCSWQDKHHIVAGPDHPLRHKRKVQLADTAGMPWACSPKGTPPYNELLNLLREQKLPQPNVVIETRSVTVLKCLVSGSDFLGWMPGSMYDAESRAGLIYALPIQNGTRQRTLTAYRRREGTLPLPAVKLLEELQLHTSDASKVRQARSGNAARSSARSTSAAR